MLGFVVFVVVGSGRRRGLRGFVLAAVFVLIVFAAVAVVLLVPVAVSLALLLPGLLLGRSPASDRRDIGKKTSIGGYHDGC